MSSKGQPSVSDYFRISRKRPVDQHPAKKRRIEHDINDHEESHDTTTVEVESVVTSAICDHLVRLLYSATGSTLYYICTLAFVEAFTIYDPLHLKLLIYLLRWY